jgi:coenzyme Q-binding protein COQ10
MHKINHTIKIAKTPEEVYSVARNPSSWATWFTGLSGPDQLTGSGEKGTVAEFTYTLVGFHFPVTVEVTEDHTNPEGCRWSSTLKGPLAGSQTYQYQPVEGGTEVKMEMEYTIPGKALGKIANRLIIERMQEKSVHQSLENLKLLCESETE